MSGYHVPAVRLEPPQPLAPVEAAPGILWLRFPQPFELNHVNVYLVEDHGGWALIDTGLGDEETHRQWEQLLAGPLQGMRLTRIIATHTHPDHVGSAGWLAERFSAPLYTNAEELALQRHRARSEEPGERVRAAAFYAGHGLDGETCGLLARQDAYFSSFIDPLPADIQLMDDMASIDIGGRRFEILTGGGHSPKGTVLCCEGEGLYFSGDQILDGITPVIGVWAEHPFDDPLAAYLEFLQRVERRRDAEALVLGGHRSPFRDISGRAAALIAHHDQRCQTIVDLCTGSARSIAEVMTLMFPRAMTPRLKGFAFGEVLAHVNLLVGRNVLGALPPESGIRRYRRV